MELSNGNGFAIAVDAGRLQTESTRCWEVEQELEGGGGKGLENLIHLLDVVYTLDRQGPCWNLENELQQLVRHTAVGDHQLTTIHFVHYVLLHILLHFQVIHPAEPVQRVKEPLTNEDVLGDVFLACFELFEEHHQVLTGFYFESDVFEGLQRVSG